MEFSGSSLPVPTSLAESTINSLRAQLEFERAFSDTLRGYLHGWERLFQVWCEDLERFRHQDAGIHQLEHDLALERRENQRLRRENDILHEQRELQYLRNSDPRGNRRVQQVTERHWGARGNSRESARIFLDHTIVAARQSDSDLGFDEQADDGFDDLYEADDEIDEAHMDELMYERDVRLPSHLRETFVHTRERLFDEEGDQYEGDTTAGDDSDYESATAIGSDDEYDSQNTGNQSDNGDAYGSDEREGIRSERSGSETSESEYSDTAVIFPTMGDRLVRTLTRLAIGAVHRVRSLRLRSPRV